MPFEGEDDDQKIKCMKCGKVIAKHNGIFGAEIKCLRCGTLNCIFEHMVEQVIITNREGIIVFINKAVETATGYTAYEAIGKKPSELWGNCMSTEFYEDLWIKMLEKKDFGTVRITNRKKTGEFYNVELSVSPISHTNGEIIFFVGIEVVVK